jgi:hypothetical protein
MVLAVSIMVLFVFFNGFVTLLVLLPYLDFPMLNVVFDEGLDYSDYDGATILNCLHGGGCPEGVTYVNDDTGETEQREVIPSKSEPVQDFSPETTGFDGLYVYSAEDELVLTSVFTDQPDLPSFSLWSVGSNGSLNLNELVSKASIFVVFVIVALSALLIFILKKKFKKSR